MFMHGMTYSGHPACCAAALKNIKILENENICGHVKRVGPLFEADMKTLEALDIVGEVRGSHFMMGIEFVKDKQTKEAFDQDTNIGGMVAKHAQQRGLIVRPLGSMAVLSPCLILEEKETKRIVDILRESISAAMESL